MAALILTSTHFADGSPISERGVVITACGRLFTFKPNDITSVDCEVSARVARKFAAAVGLSLVPYTSRSHRHLLVGGESDGSILNDVDSLVELRNEFPREDVLGMSHHEVASLAVRLGTFQDMKVAKMLPLDSLRHVVLAKLAYPIAKSEPVTSLSEDPFGDEDESDDIDEKVNTFKRTKKGGKR